MKSITIILVGGKSSRMGQDKGLLLFEGEPLLARQVRRYRGLCDGIGISVDRAGRFDLCGGEEIVDRREGNQGPLAGMEAAFLQTGAETMFLTAVDIPFGAPALARHLMALRGDCDACYIRRADGRPEPLFAAYGRTCLPKVTAALDEGRRSFYGIFDRMKVREVAERELAHFDLKHILMNVNSPEELLQAQHLLGEGR